MKQLTLTFAVIFALSASAFAQTATKKAAPVTSTKTAVQQGVKAMPVPSMNGTPMSQPAIKTTTNPATAVPTPPVPTPQTVTPPNEIDKVAKFDKTEHDFGKLVEGPQATTEFKVKNISNEPLTISNVQASCGCTVPSWTKEPIAPGATGTIKAIYNTQGRPGNFTKTLTVTTSKGTKMLNLKGNVEKAPDTSVPAPDNKSMIKQ
jgi:hypothetical protein